MSFEILRNAMRILCTCTNKFTRCSNETKTGWLLAVPLCKFWKGLHPYTTGDVSNILSKHQADPGSFCKGKQEVLAAAEVIYLRQPCAGICREVCVTWEEVFLQDFFSPSCSNCSTQEREVGPLSLPFFLC